MSTLYDHMFTIMYIHGLYVNQTCNGTVYLNMISKFLVFLWPTKALVMLETIIFIWQVLRGKYVFTFGDHGGVIIAVPYRRYTKTLR